MPNSYYSDYNAYPKGATGPPPKPGTKPKTVPKPRFVPVTDDPKKGR